MSNTSLARDQRISTREERATEIARRHAREIAESASGSVYKVPACGGVGVYVVSLSQGTCECADFEHQGEPCKHVLAAEIVSAKSRCCADCNHRFLGRDLYEVGDDHLCWFEGDELCRTCAISAGVL